MKTDQKKRSVQTVVKKPTAYSISLSAGGQAEMPMGYGPWGTYFGMLRNKYDIEWTVKFDPK